MVILLSGSELALETHPERKILDLVRKISTRILTNWVYLLFNVYVII